MDYELENILDAEIDCLRSEAEDACGYKYDDDDLQDGEGVLD